MLLFGTGGELRKRPYEKRQESFGDQTAGIIGNVAIDYCKVPSDAHYFCIRGYASSFHTFQVIDLHFNCRNARSQGARHIGGEASGCIRQRRQNSTVDHSVNLQVAVVHFEAKEDAAADGFYEPETHLL